MRHIVNIHVWNNNPRPEPLENKLVITYFCEDENSLCERIYYMI